MSTAQYDECIRLLKKAGAQHPAGRKYHACFGPADHVQVFDVWTSQAQFEAFGRTLMPILQQIGVDPGQPMVTTMHNVIIPPAAKAPAKAAKKMKKTKKKKAAPARRAARRK
jgi:hypothetical protein